MNSEMRKLGLVRVYNSQNFSCTPALNIGYLHIAHLFGVLSASTLCIQQVYGMSCAMRIHAFCICKNKGAGQLQDNLNSVFAT